MDELRSKHEWESGFFTLKKYKEPSEILKPFNGKDYETYKNTAIHFVNDDCLAEIFMYVPACERPKIALVCHKWKKALDFSWGNVKKLQITHWERAEYPNCLKKYPTPDGKLRFLKSLLYKCGRFLTELDLTAYGYSDIVPVINKYCPNLVKLRLRFIDDNKILRHAFSRLSKLKVFKVIFQHIKRMHSQLFYVIAALESLANTLIDLTLCYWKDNLHEWCDLPNDVTIDVLRQLKVLKKLEISGLRKFPKLAEYLRDNPTIKFAHYDINVAHYTVKSYELMGITKLNLMKEKVSDDILYIMANTMKQLTTLKINCESITNEGVVAISNMKNLIHLCFFGVNDSIDSSSIKLLKNLIKLILPRSNKITDDLATKLLENSPKMTVIFVLYTSVTVEFINKAAEISRNRKEHMTLGVTFGADNNLYESPYFKIVYLPKMNEITDINMIYNDRLIEKLIFEFKI